MSMKLFLLYLSSERSNREEFNLRRSYTGPGTTLNLITPPLQKRPLYMTDSRTKDFSTALSLESYHT